MGGAQIMLKWLRTGAWSKLTDVLTAIRQELQSVQPIDTASIRWEKDAEGMRAYVTAPQNNGEMAVAGEDGGGGSGTLEYEGPFALSFDSTKQKVVVEAGFARLNGMFVTVAKTELTPATNYICVNSELSNYGIWSPPVIQFATPSMTNYPIGRCDATEIPPPEPEEGEEPDPPTYKINDLIPFMQPVAIIFGTGDCMEALIVPES